MAIPNNYIDKITKEGDSRPICPAADKVRVDNENFEGADLDAVLDEVAEAIDEAAGGYNPPADGIPKSDLAQGVQESLNKADTAVQDNDYTHTDNNYTDAEKTKLAGIAAGAQVNVISGIKAHGDSTNLPVVDGVVELPEAQATDMDDYYTKSEADAAISEALIGQAIAVATGDFVLTEDDSHFYITPVVPAVSVSPEVLSFYGITKTATFKVSGANLKGNVTVATAATNWSLRIGSGTSSQSLTLTPTDGTLAETTITVMYSGSADSVGNTITITSQGAEAAVVTASYTVYQGPTISVDNQSLSLEDVAGYNDGTNATKTLTVGGSQLTETIAAAITGTNANRFSVSGTLTTSGGTLAINYHPQVGDSGTHSATLTLSSSGATSVVVQLTGTVLTQSLSITPATLELESQSGSSVSGTITVQGTNIKGDVTVSVASSGNGFTVSPNTLTASQANAGAQVTVTADTNSASGTITATTSGATPATSSVTWDAVAEKPVLNGTFEKNGLTYYVTVLPSGSTNGTVTLVNNNQKIPSATQTGGDPSYPGMTDIVVPDTISITYAENGALVTEYYDVTAIGQFAFKGCTGISSLTLTDGKLTSIGAAFIMGCTGITDIKIPDSVTSIGNQMSGLKYIVNADYGANLSSLGASNFYGSNVLTTLVLRLNKEVSNINNTHKTWIDVPSANNLGNTTGIKVFVPTDQVQKRGTTAQSPEYETRKEAYEREWASLVESGKVVFYALEQYDPENPGTPKPLSE